MAQNRAHEIKVLSESDSKFDQRTAQLMVQEGLSKARAQMKAHGQIANEQVIEWRNSHGE